jgi:tetratricopeptide (TPR) repeat protein
VRFLFLTSNLKFDAGLVRKSISTKWIIVRKKSNGYEVDISTDDLKVIEKMKNMFQVETVINLDDKPDLDALKELPEILDEVSLLFLQERYWEAHEFLEYYWKHYYGKEKMFINGLILVSVSMVKYQMGQLKEARTIYDRAIHLLEKSESPLTKRLNFPEDFKYPLRFG